MLSQLRKRVKVIMFFVAISFVAGFLLNEVWQMLRSRTPRSSWEKGIVGKVGKKTITRDEYFNTVEYFAYRYLKENKLREISETERENIHSQAWQYLISEKIWQDILKQEKIKITAEEVNEIVRFNPPPELRNHPDLMTDGEFDQEKYLNVLANPANQEYFSLYVRDLIDMLPKEKLRIDVNAMYRITSGEIEDRLNWENTSVKTTYLYFSPKMLKEPYQPTEEEIKEYYEKNRKEFETPEVHRLRYVFFTLQTTAEDSLDAQRQIEDAYAEIKSVEDFSFLINDFSDMPYETTAVWFAKNSFDERTQTILDSLQPGMISKPFFSTEGWQIINLEEKKKDSVKVKRILVRIKMTSTTTAMVQDSINKFLERAKHEDFDTLCQEFGLTPLLTQVLKGKDVNFPGINSNNQLKNFALRAKPNELSEPMRGRGGYFIFRLEGITESSSHPWEGAKQMIEWRIRRDKDKVKLIAKAEENYKKLFSGKPFEAIVQEDPTIEIYQDSFPSFDRCSKAKGAEFAGALYALKPKETSGVVTTDWGSFIIRCDERKEVVKMTSDVFHSQRRQEVANRILSELIKTPEVQDYRPGLLY